MGSTIPPRLGSRGTERSKMKFNKWVNQKTGEVRIYVNGAASYGVKVYVVDGGTTGHFSAGFPEVVVRSDSMIGQSEVDRISDMIDEHVKQAVPSDANPTFADYLSLAK